MAERHRGRSLHMIILRFALWVIFIKKSAPLIVSDSEHQCALWVRDPHELESIFLLLLMLKS